ncbi:MULTISPECIES: helix-turn-helix domain-containing protein [Lelliottia]|uniref:Transcriptional regulator n=1 Tax=Lelliottia aquatilis TaxID=2080838 RepID=A0ABX5A2X8_9ENTR|nr:MULTISPECIES: helix-turn-helix domain-containing protein [Lelliottia]POZ14087.1 transcriptional regulator [Lelliottia aquatilis]POZ23989.1 transcriptional regulator [Lelliottia aquatilis]POZ27609.1 transcriptional regulator [Lelliottia sp. 7254-16]POZ29878.1 transcriptional regulator [Lelliottia aquatilis]POZ35443.1 transcriptional regulator [Lelliottia aquatilis]
MKTIGQRIKERRLELKYSQRSLGKRAGVAHVTISQWERDETSPRGDNLFNLAEALSVEPGWIIRGDTGNDSESDKAAVVLTPQQKELIDLFERLPVSEKEQHIQNLKHRVQECDETFNDLLKTKSKKEILEIIKNLDID